MIILEVEDYCHNGCKYFTPQVFVEASTNIIKVNQPFVSTDTIVVCVNRHQCAYARSGLNMIKLS